jgi:uncharacterized damage-inducible protein DinB
MILSPAAIIISAYCQTHERILKLAGKLSDEQLHWRYTSVSHSIAFHLWHVARWADHFQAAVPGMTTELGRRLGPGAQVWESEGLAARWGFDAGQLGYGATGMTMPDDVAANLPFPNKAELLAYLRQALAAADQAVKAIDEQQFQETEQPQPLTEGIWGGSTVGDAVVVHLTHTNRHLGMIECLAGLQLGSGTATV